MVAYVLRDRSRRSSLEPRVRPVRMSASRSTSRATRSRLGTVRRRFSGHHAVRARGRTRRAGRLREVVRAFPRSARQPRRRHHFGSGNHLAGDRADAGRCAGDLQPDGPVDRHGASDDWFECRRPDQRHFVAGGVATGPLRFALVRSSRYGGVFADRTYGTPALGFGYRAELDSFAIDVAFLNYQFASPGAYSSPRASAFSWLKLSGLRFLDPQRQSLRVLRRRLELRAQQHQPWELFLHARSATARTGAAAASRES